MTHDDVIIFEKLKLKKNSKTNNSKKNYEIPLNPAKDINITRFTYLRFARQVSSVTSVDSSPYLKLLLRTPEECSVRRNSLCSVKLDWLSQRLGRHILMDGTGASMIQDGADVDVLRGPVWNRPWYWFKPKFQQPFYFWLGKMIYY